MSQNRNLSIFATKVNSSGILTPSGGGIGSTSTPTNGQIPIGNGANYTPATITAGNNISITNGAGSINISASIAAGNGPAFSSYASSSLTLTNGSAAKAPLDTRLFDTNNNFSIGNYNFLPTVAGYYQISGAGLFGASNALTSGQVFLYKNGILTASGSNVVSGVQVNQTSNISYLIYMNGTTDYLELFAVAYGSGSLTLVGGLSYTYMTGFLARVA